MVARTFEMEPDERILLKETSVGEGDWSSCKGELVLTDRALIYVDRGLFGGFRGYTRFRLDEITQALAGTSPNGSHQLEVYHKDGQDNFVFGSAGKRRSVEWKNAIDGQLVRLGRMVADAPEREDDGGRGVAEAIGSVARTGGVIVGGIVRGVGQAALGFVDGLGVTGHGGKPDTPDGRDDALSKLEQLRDLGVLTPEEYEEKAAKLRDE
ncbi:SHOCT domain-containing protein [uncultured Bifidobacterium sp.]|uniref:SHOCT domain-containing protein n=1 Tax=uncultured Bifidobacterium sp. TaxID=165187 RepID=UPI0025970292|nr:SHOCT domain-containing protein [uncultured Bifidobacterium sp.]